MDIHTDIRADVRVELSMLRTVRPGIQHLVLFPSPLSFPCTKHARKGASERV